MRVMMQDDVGAATSFVEGEVRRLLAGNCETWEMVMTVRIQPVDCTCQFGIGLTAASFKRRSHIEVVCRTGMRTPLHHATAILFKANIQSCGIV